MVSLLNKLVGNSSEKLVKKTLPTVEKINGFETAMKGLSDTDLRDQTAEFKSRLSGRETLDDLMPEAFAAVREAARRGTP